MSNLIKSEMVLSGMGREDALELAREFFDAHATEQKSQSFSLTVAACHGAAVSGGWWHDIMTGEPLARNVGELIALIHSELSEALEGYRKGQRDEHLPHRESIEVELADAVIRIFDLAGAMGLDLESTIAEKVAFNLVRADFTLEERSKPSGKKF